MTSVIGIREVARNIDSLSKYDYVQIEDKKTHQQKGFYVSQKYAKELKEMIDKIIEKENLKKIDELTSFIGICDGDTKNKSSQEIKALKIEKYAQ